MTLWEAMGQVLAGAASPVAVTVLATLVFVATIMGTILATTDAIDVGFDRSHLIAWIGGPLVAFLSLSVVIWAFPLTATNTWP